jgi:hypothetical protein
MRDPSPTDPTLNATMTNLILNLDIVTMEWSDQNFRVLYTGDAYEFPAFQDGYYQGTQYAAVEITMQNGEWKNCGEGTGQSSPLTVTLPNAGHAYTRSFCVHASEGFPILYRKGWFDPQLKLKNQDSTGAPSGYEDVNPGSCECS